MPERKTKLHQVIEAELNNHLPEIEEGLRIVFDWYKRARPSFVARATRDEVPVGDLLDDYLSKLLQSRIASRAPDSGTLTVGAISLEANGACTVGGGEVKLTKSEIRALKVLMSANGAAVEQDELMRRCELATVTSLRNIMSKLRKKVGANRIETIKGNRPGYRLVG